MLVTFLSSLESVRDRQKAGLSLADVFLRSPSQQSLSYVRTGLPVLNQY